MMADPFNRKTLPTGAFSMYQRMFNFTLLALLLTATNAVGEQSYKILLPGEWPGQGISAESGTDWWGVFPDGDGFTLQATPVTVTPVHDSMMDRDGEMTGKKVTIAQESTPVLLIQGLKDPAAGTILPARLGPRSWPSDQATAIRQNAFLFPGQSHRLSLPTDSVRLTALGTVEEDPTYRHPQIMNHQLKLYRGDDEKAVSQALMTIPRMGDLGEPHLVWAGDIDRDGKIDLIYDLTDHYVKTHLALFLSSAARVGELVGLVAEWKWSSC
jgi:hypothetical protein